MTSHTHGTDHPGAYPLTARCGAIVTDDGPGTCVGPTWTRARVLDPRLGMLPPCPVCFPESARRYYHKDGSSCADGNCGRAHLARLGAMAPPTPDLRRLAEAATPGPWGPGVLEKDAICGADNDDAWAGKPFRGVGGPVVLRPTNGGSLPTKADAAYIAAANPRAVIGLLDTIERLHDLVRHQRGPLHDAGLLTDEEYVALAADHGAVGRLETVDGLRMDLNAYRTFAVSIARMVASPGAEDTADDLEALDLGALEDVVRAEYENGHAAGDRARFARCKEDLARALGLDVRRAPEWGEMVGRVRDVVRRADVAAKRWEWFRATSQVLVLYFHTPGGVGWGCTGTSQRTERIVSTNPTTEARAALVATLRSAQSPWMHQAANEIEALAADLIAVRLTNEANAAVIDGLRATVAEMKAQRDADVMTALMRQSEAFDVTLGIVTRERDELRAELQHLRDVAHGALSGDATAPDVEDAIARADAALAGGKS